MITQTTPNNNLIESRCLPMSSYAESKNFAFTNDELRQIDAAINKGQKTNRLNNGSWILLSKPEL